jgi:cytoskeletal protein RodZ
MPSNLVIGIIVLVFLACVAVGIWAAVTYGGGSPPPPPMADTSSPAPSPTGTPSQVAMSAITPAVQSTTTGGAALAPPTGTPSQVAMSAINPTIQSTTTGGAALAPPPPSTTAPNVVGMAYQFGQVGDASGAPQLRFQSFGSCNVTVRVRGTTLTMPVVGGAYTNGDVYVKFGSPYTGPVVLEKTDGTQLAIQTVTGASSVIFGAAAHN